MFVLDTNAVIHFFKNKGQVAEHLLATAPGDIGLPAVQSYWRVAHRGLAWVAGGGHSTGVH